MTRRSLSVLAFVLTMIAGSVLHPVFMQERGGRGQPGNPKPMHRVGGTRDGASAFLKVDYPQLKPLQPGLVDFKHYHGLEETLALLKGWAQQYPGLVDLYSVGRSFEGRDIWQITITSKKTGKDTDKPAFFLEGGRHAGEISGIEATLYFINHVLTQYGSDPDITRLVDTTALYCRPNNNPDGNALYQVHRPVAPQHRPAQRRRRRRADRRGSRRGPRRRRLRPPDAEVRRGGQGFGQQGPQGPRRPGDAPRPRRGG